MGYDCIVVGAGVSGLLLTYRLTKAGQSVLLLESSDRAGGVIQSVNHEGFLLELGPNSSLEKDALIKLAAELNIEQELIRPAPQAKRRYLGTNRGLRSGKLRLCSVPVTPFQFLTTPLLSPASKCRVLLEPLSRRSAREDESVASFMSRHLGQEFTHSVVSAMLGGIWAADISRLSARSALSRAWELEQNYRSLMLGGIQQLAKRDKAKPTNKPSIISFKQGMQTLTDALMSALPAAQIQYGESISRLRLEHQPHHRTIVRTVNKTGEQREYEARKVVLTTPAYVTGRLINDYAPRLSERISAIPYAPVGVVHLAFNAKNVSHALDGFGFLIPPRDRCPLLGAIFNSSLFPGRAPAGTHLLTCFAGGATNPQLADVKNPQITRRIIEEVSSLIGADAAPRVLSELHWSRAIPNYPVNHHRTLAEIVGFCSTYPQLTVLANWYEGISVSDRIIQAERLAKTICAETNDRQHVVVNQ